MASMAIKTFDFKLRGGSVKCAPTNKRIIVYGRMFLSDSEDEVAMAWLDKGDGQWYYSPQGGQLLFTPMRWLEVPL